MNKQDMPRITSKHVDYLRSRNTFNDLDRAVDIYIEYTWFEESTYKSTGTIFKISSGRVRGIIVKMLRYMALADDKYASMS